MYPSPQRSPDMSGNILQDRFGRRIEYLRLSVTDRCDLRCTYCMPERFKDFDEPANWLNSAEILRVAGVFARLGVSKIRITGGEPLTRRNIVDISAGLAQLPGVEDLSLSTNATQLAIYAKGLRETGVGRLNVSLDSLQPERFARIVRRNCLEQVLDGLMAAKREGFAPIKINMVVLDGVNQDEIDDMVGFCMEHGFVLRLIETMPMGTAGRSAGYVDLRPVRERLRKRFGLLDGLVKGNGPARYLQAPDGSFSVGFITPISQHFCETCNRVRLSADGTLFMCLGQDERMDLRRLLRDGASDSDLESAIRSAIEMKPERHEFSEKPEQIVRFMSATGG